MTKLEDIIKIYIFFLFIFISSNIFSIEKINFYKQFGTKGTGEGQFNNPRGISIDSQANIYIADTENNRIQIFDADGKFKSAFGIKGTGAGQFNSPSNVIVEHNKIFVLDNGNNRIQIFDKDRNFLFSFGKIGKEHGQFTNIIDFAVLYGRIYILDSNNRLQIFSETGIFLNSLFLNVPDPQFKTTKFTSFAIDKSGNIYVLDALSCFCLKFDNRGLFISKFGGKGQEQQNFTKPQNIWIDNYGYIYISDSVQNKIKKFSPNFDFVFSFGTKGVGIGQFENLQRVIGNNASDKIYALDSGNNRVQIFNIEQEVKDKTEIPIIENINILNWEILEISADDCDIAGDKLYCVFKNENVVGIFDIKNKTLDKFGTKGKEKSQFNSPSAIAVDSKENIYVADSGNNRIQKFDKNKNFILSFGTRGNKEGEFNKISAIALDKQDNIYVVDSGNDRVQVFSSDGIFMFCFGKTGSLSSQFKNPSDIAIDNASQNIYVADSGNNRIQKFDRRGGFLLEFGAKGEGDGKFNRIESIFINYLNEVFVIDSIFGNVQIFDKDGKFLWRFGAKGTGISEFLFPKSIFCKGNFVYIVDSGSKCIKVLRILYPLVAPDNLIAEAKTDGIKITFTKKTEPYITRYRIYKSSTPKIIDFKKIDDIKEPIYIDKDIETNTTYYYAITSISDDERESTFSKIISVRTPKFIPLAPSHITTTSTHNEIKIEIEDKKEKNIIGYKIYKSEDGKTGTYKEIADIKENFYIDSNLLSGKKFFYYITAYSKDGESEKSNVLEISTKKLIPDVPKDLKIEPKEDQITISWTANTEEYFKSYKIYRVEKNEKREEVLEFLAELKENLYNDKDLKENTEYCYRISAVSDDGESDKSPRVCATTLKIQKPVLLLDIDKIETQRIFAANYKFYIDNPVMKIVLNNPSQQDIQKISIVFKIKDYMDFPSEKKIDVLKAKEKYEVSIFATFNNKILDITEDTPISSEIKILYTTKDNEEKTITKNIPLLIYSRNALIWDDKRRIATFVTPKDDVLKEFARGIVQQYAKENETLPISQNLLIAREIFAGLGTYGVVYIQDPNNPYQVSSENKDKIDYLQFPRETLKHKSGDCDDLVCLYSAALENIAVPTCLIDAPGHIFMMFDTGVDELAEEDFGFPKDRYIKHNGTLWIPIEATLIGDSFLKAWEVGVKKFKMWQAENKIDIIDLQKSWDIYKPATLPPSALPGEIPQRSEIENKFKGELDEIIRLRIDNMCKIYKNVLEINPNDITSLKQLGIIYAEHNLLDEAEKYFKKILELDKNNATALNNLGNIYLLKENFEEAIKFYNDAYNIDSKDAEILVNLSTAHYKSGNIKQAKISWEKAKEINPDIIYIYSELQELFK